MQLVKTDEIATARQLARQFDIDVGDVEDAQVHQVCAGAYVRETVAGDVVWRFYEDPEWKGEDA